MGRMGMKVEPLTVAAASALTMKYVIPAITHFGKYVLDASEEAAGNEVVSFGRRLLRALFQRTPATENDSAAALRDGIQRRVRRLVDDPKQEKVIAQLEGAIEDLLSAEPALLAEIVELLNRAPSSLAQGQRSINVSGNNSGTLVTGDGNTITAWTFGA